MTGVDPQLAPFAEGVARELRIGSGMLDALAEAGNEVGGLVGRDMARAVELVAAGETLRDVLAGWARHRNSSELAVLVALLSVGVESGGDLAAGLESFAAGRRDADDLAGEVRALTSQARASAVFLVALPVVAATFLGFVEPATLGFLFGSVAGRCCLVAAVALDAVAWWCMHLLGRSVAMPRGPVRSLRSVLPVVDVVRLGLAAGLRPPAAFDLAARHLGASPPLARFRLATDRGASFVDATREWSAAVGRPADELVALLVAAHRSGATVAPALDGLARELRRRHRQASQERARRLPVLLVPPLVLLVLPAFGLVAVVPMLAVGLAALRAAV